MHEDGMGVAWVWHRGGTRVAQGVQPHEGAHVGGRFRLVATRGWALQPGVGSSVRPEPATRVAYDRPVLASQCRQWGTLCETWGRHDAVGVEVLHGHPSISSTDDL
jgi:hypothetical protein